MQQFEFRRKETVRFQLSGAGNRTLALELLEREEAPKAGNVHKRNE